MVRSGEFLRLRSRAVERRALGAFTGMALPRQTSNACNRLLLRGMVLPLSFSQLPTTIII